VTRAAIQAALRSLVADANDALAAIADDRYSEALEALRCGPSDLVRVVEGLKVLEEEMPSCRCDGSCVECRGLSAAEYE
jgi:hypothetical protein